MTQQTTTVDLTNCDREPIHRPGRVQSYGALIAVDPDWTVSHASANLSDILGIDVHAAIGASIDELLSEEAMRRIRRNMGTVDSSENAVRIFGLKVRDDLGPFDASIHQSGRRLIIEFEPTGSSADVDLMSEVHPLIRRIRFKGDVATLARDAARSLRGLSRFDSVMVYRFEKDGSGCVIAEDRADGRTCYLGQHFPASDIPAQARRLYKRSLLRLIADVRDPGVVILPGESAENALDLSLAITRAVSPIHIEYLSNMGVEASMSVSIMKDGELWGLFACHHDRPHYIDYQRRTAVEMFGHLFAYELARYDTSIRQRAEVDIGDIQTRLLSRIGEERSLASQLLSISEEIGKVIAHDGVAILNDGSYERRGDTPDEAEFRALLGAFDTQPPGVPLAFESLSLVHPPASAYAERYAGALAIRVSSRPGDYVVFFRKPVDSTVSWAGDPTKPVTVGPNGIRLTPRRSFELWQETVKGHSEPWSDYALLAADRLHQVILAVILRLTEASATERKRAAEQQQLLISELNHRVRNILNLMRGLVAQSKAGASSVTDFTDSLDGRIHSLARAHDQLTRDNFVAASLKELIRCEFEAYEDGKRERVVVTGPDAMISPQAYTTLALVLHEMATNSIKYGALCDRSGRVTVALSFAPDGMLSIAWKERGGPPVAPPIRQGFGTTIIERSIPHELGGTSEIDYKVGGVEARFTLPASFATEADDTPEAIAESAPASGKRPLPLSGNGLVLEDSLIIALDAADILAELGAGNVAICASVREAMTAIDKETPAFALLDVNLGDEQSVPVAERLHELGVPFVLATGYGDAAALVEAYPPCEIVQKPFSTETLSVALKRLFDGRLSSEGT